MITLVILSLLVGLAYFFLILSYLYGWEKTKVFADTLSRGKTSVSVIIAVRNEAMNIPQISRALLKQSYAKELIDILFIDDHSTDATKEVIRFCMKDVNNYSIIDCKGEGKKDAIITGYQNARGDLIITTDADCAFGEYWISSIVSFYENNETDFIIGPVLLNEGPGIFHDLQALDFLSLTGTMGGSAGIGKPVLCSGGNLAFSKNIVVPDQQTLKNQFASGEDMFLLQQTKKIQRNNPKFLKSKHAVVSSLGQPDWRSFWDQRKRWTSKSRGYKDFDTIFVALIVFLINLSILFSLISSLINTDFLLVFLALMVIKSVPDLLFMYRVTSFFGKQYLLKYFLILQCIYFIYVSILPFISLAGKYTWKNRNYGVLRNR